jgi:hypothetical protein
VGYFEQEPWIKLGNIRCLSWRESVGLRPRSRQRILKIRSKYSFNADICSREGAQDINVEGKRQKEDANELDGDSNQLKEQSVTLGLLSVGDNLAP